MAKKIGDIIIKIPKTEKICLTYKADNGKTFLITVAMDESNYFLYEKAAAGLKYLKSRKKDPCFPECY